MGQGRPVPEYASQGEHERITRPHAQPVLALQVEHGVARLGRTVSGFGANLGTRAAQLERCGSRHARARLEEVPQGDGGQLGREARPFGFLAVDSAGSVMGRERASREGFPSGQEWEEATLPQGALRRSPEARCQPTSQSPRPAQRKAGRVSEVPEPASLEAWGCRHDERHSGHRARYAPL